MNISCLTCKNKFMADTQVTGFCTYLCYQNWTSLVCFPSNCKKNYYNKKRRAIVLAGDKINRILLSEDYNWICQLCFEPIHPNKRFPDELSSSVDHIIPLSKGGKHVFSNVQPAHLKCNLEKGNTWAKC